MRTTLANENPANSTGTAYTAPPRLQQRTSRSFTTTAPPDALATWLMLHAFVPIGTSASSAEYGRFRLGDELVILYWNGSTVASGESWECAARRLENLCEPEPPQVTLFDLLDAEEGAE